MEMLLCLAFNVILNNEGKDTTGTFLNFKKRDNLMIFFHFNSEISFI